MRRRNRVIITIGLLAITVVTSIFFRQNENLVFAFLEKEQPIFRVNREDKAVSLTFDVNWAEEEYLQDILNVLEKYNVKATFFVMGKWVNYPEGNKEKLIKINEGGHEIGNHSYVHPMFPKIDDARIKEELEKTDQIIKDTIGVEPTKLFRFPSGDYNGKSYNTVSNLGYIPIQWDVDSVDWKQSNADTEYQRVMKKVKPGSIILFHNNAKYTPGNLEKIIPELQNQGYKFLPISELIYNEEYYINEEGEQRKK
ncbi:polysaccharide deacetylase family protein [Clostridium chauvoei]|uniref:Polysaccharide deacetylase family protein n=2 Tax=Clostridium chauvoei TaxID=46867 RepID=A0ABD4REX5_9CLOT|nr:polysaccharide deacetylase family protein [Clostridium chauvoei]ATD55292.1 deacetylase [Clostridium chauvoei]ATD57034.1 deacetylase [Clostridium chauvoei]MBX7279645.1 polysaccharide deacetylase family protein [Clostridium chauvoei]MBX7282014.1 polysaccharide deacetylase family protein [Clostridium chauvoei]MBX7284397.1 polysaccharide deacetylase family protein [Clostridium chauvoei]